MGDMYPNSYIRLANNDKVTLLLDGSIPGLVLYPENENSVELVDSVKDTLSARGFYVKCYSQNDCDFSRLSGLITENPLLVVILDGLNPNIVFAYGYFKANGRSIFPVFNANDLKKSKSDQLLFDLDEYVSFDLSGTSPVEISSGLRDVLEQYLDENLETIVSNYAELILNEARTEGPLSEELRSLLYSILDMHTGEAESGADILNDVCTRISDLEKNHGISFPGKAYSILPYIYLSLFQKGVLTTLELKKGIKNIENISQKLYVTGSDDIDLLLLRKRVADSHTLLSVYDKRVQNCRISIDRLEKFLDDLVTEDISLYRAKILNNLGVNYLLIEDCTGEREYPDKSVYYFQLAIESIDKSRFPLEFARITMNLGISLYTKAFYNSENQLFADALNTFRNCYETFTPELFPQEHYESGVQEANTLRELSLRNDDTETLGRSFELYNAALSFFTSDLYPADHARILTEMARSYMIYFTITRNEDYYLKSGECYRSALEIYTLTDYPVNYALTIAAIGELFLTYAKLTGSELSGEAIPLLEEALTLIRFEDYPPAYGSVQVVLGDSYSYLGSVHGDEESFLRSVESYEQALRFYTDKSYPTEYSEINKKSARAYKGLSALNPDSIYPERAINSYQKSLETSSPESRPLLYSTVYKETGDVYSIILENSDNTDGYRDLAVTTDTQKNLTAAMDIYSELITIAEKANNYVELSYGYRKTADCLRMFGELANDTEILEKAVTSYEHTLSYYKQGDDQEDTRNLYSQIAACQESMYRILRDRGEIGKALQCLDKAISVYGEFDDRYSQNKLSYQKAMLLKLKADENRDADEYIEAANILRTLPDLNGNENGSFRSTGIYEELADIYSSAAELKGTVELLELTAENYMKALQISSTAGNSEKTLELNRKTGEAHQRIGDIRYEAGEYDQALTHYRNALKYLDKQLYNEIYTQIQKKIVESYKKLGAYMVGDDTGSAINLYESALEISRNSGDRNKTAEIQTVLASMYQEFGESDNNPEQLKLAIKYYTESLELYDQVDHPQLHAEIYLGLSNCYRLLSQFEEKEHCLKKNIDYLNEALLYYTQESDLERYVSINESVVSAYEELGETCHTNGDSDASREYYTKALKYYEEKGDKEKTAYIRNRINEILKSAYVIEGSEDPETVIGKLESLSEIYRSEGDTARYRDIMIQLGDTLLETGGLQHDDRLSRACDIYRQLADDSNIDTSSEYYASVMRKKGLACRLLSKDDIRDLLSESYKANTESLSVYIRNRIEDYRVTLTDEIEQEILLIFDADLRCMSFTGATAEYWKNISLLESLPLTGKITGIHVAASEIAVKNAGDSDCKDVVIFLEQLRDRIQSSDPDQGQNDITGRLYEAYINTASFCFNSSEYLESIQFYTNAGSLISSCENTGDELEVQYGLAYSYRSLWKQERNESYLKKSIRNFEKCSDHVNSEDAGKAEETGNILYQLKTEYADILISRGDYENADYTELVKRYEDILQNINAEGSPEEYAVTCVKLGRCFLQIARGSGSQGDYEASIEAFQSAIGVYGSDEYQDKRAEIYMELGNVYKSLALNTDDPEFFGLMTDSYKRALKYYNYEDFPEINAVLLKEIAHAETHIAELTGDTGRYRESADKFRQALRYFNRDDHPQEFADINRSLGVSCSIIYELDPGRDILESSIDAFSNAIDFYIAGNDIANVASVSKYLGTAYCALAGISNNSAEYLGKSAEYYKRSADIFLDQGNVSEYGFVSRSLAAVYAELAELEDMVVNLKNAINSYKGSPGYYTYNDTPEEYASINNHLGTLYKKLSEFEDTAWNCCESVKCFEKVLNVYSNDEFPMEYAATMNNLGIAYRALAEAENKAENCKRSVESYLKVLQVYTLKDFPVQYSTTQNNLGSAYRTLAEEENRKENCRKAIKAYEEALKVRKIQTMPAQFAATQNNLGVSYRALAEVEDKEKNCMQAIKAYESALIIYTIDKFPVQYATTKINIAGAYSTLAEVKEREKNCDLSIECYREAQRVFNIDDFEDVYEMIEESINDLASFREYAG